MHIRIGTSSDQDSTLAIREAVQGTDKEADFVWIFASSHYDPEHLVAELRQVFGHTPMAGCSTAGELSTYAYSNKSCVVVTIRSQNHRFGVGAVSKIEGDERQSGYDCAKQAYDQLEIKEPVGAFVLLSDGLVPRQHELVYGAYMFCGADIPIVGGAAADNRILARTFQIANGHVYTNAVIGVWIQTKEPIGIGIGHGWKPKSQLLRVTQAKGSVVEQLNGRPALQMYLDSLGVTKEELSTSRISTLGIDHPLGMISSEGDFEIRHVLGLEDQSLICFGNVRDGSLLSVMEANEEDLLSASAQAVKQAFEKRGEDASLALVFSCVARSVRLQERVLQEWEGMKGAVPEIQLAGFYTYGEFARFDGKVGFYNGTVVCLIL